MKRNSISLSNVVVGVHKSNTLDILEEISDFRSDSFTLIDIELPGNSYMITCTNTQSFLEEGENCAYTISVENLEPLFHTLGYDMTLFGSNFRFQEPPVILVFFSHQFWCEKTSTSSLFQIFYWGFGVNFLS